MKLTSILMFCAIMQVSASVYSQKAFLELKLRDAEVSEVFEAIKNQSQFDFLYKSKLIKNLPKVSVELNKVTITEVLDNIIPNELEYEIYDKTIIIRKNTTPVVEEIISEEADVDISGKVNDENGQGLPGASIVVKGTTNGTTTDFEGNYKLTVPDDAVLLISFVGYQTQEIVVGNQSLIDVQLTVDAAQLDEIVVIGYGEVERKDVTGSIVSFDADQIKQTNKVNAVQALQGQVAGVDIQSAGNKPGDGFNIRIRGSSTINSNESVGNGGYSPGQNPLFVVDGIFVSDISFLNPADIEKMDVLKDASATAIYGARGSNGVVIIQTKKGEAGKLSIQYDSYVGVRKAYNLPRIFEGEEFVDFFTDAAVGVEHSGGNTSFGRGDVVLSDFLRPNEIANISNGDYVDWVDLALQSGMQTNHSISASGGNDKTTYGFGIAFTKDEGTFPGENLDRYNLRGNVSSQISPAITLSYNHYVTYSVRDEGSREGFRSAYRLRPTGTAFDTNGDPEFWPIQDETFITNPLFEESNITRETSRLNYLANFALTVKPIENLTVTTTFSPDIAYERYGEYRGIQAKSTGERQDRTRADVTNRNFLSYVWDNVINYNVDFSDHSIGATLVSSTWKRRFEDFRLQVRDFSTDEFLFYNQDAGADVRNTESSFEKETLQSYTARLNYSFKDKYIFTVTGRYDGSSKLSNENKWAFFPSAAFAWRVIDEGFMSGQETITNLKLRLSYGQTGNNGTGGGLDPLDSQSGIETDFVTIGDEVVQTAFVPNLANQNLKWERTSELNVGIDYGFLDNRIYGALEIYSRKTKDLIFGKSVPAITGFDEIFENVGEVSNKGVELSIGSVNIDNGDFKWTSSVNFAKNNNEITFLQDGVDELFFSVRSASQVHKVGEEVGSLYTYVWDGIWQSDESDLAQSYGFLPGQVKVKDLNDDGAITDEDRTVIGSLQPSWTGGITNTLSFKNLDFSFFIYTRQGVESFSWFHRSHGWDQDNRPARFNGLKTNYWTPDNPSNEWYQPGNSGSRKDATFYQDVSFVKVGYITLGYNLPSSITESLKLESFRIYATAQNPFVFTSYEGWDPEYAGRNSWGSAAASRTLLLGVNVKF